jgi:hypothetical protein
MNSGPEKPDTLIGVRLGDYKVLRLIGRGGMARVYEGYDENLDRRAAIKVMEAQPSDTGEDISPRFFREARAVAKLDHPNIVTVYQFGEAGGYYYLAMKLIEGKTLLTNLKALRKRRRFIEAPRILHILSQVASAIDYAHTQGVIHRDIKPSNIMLAEDDKATLMDFGLTMQLGGDSTLGTAFGTPRYIAPEQAISSHRAVSQSDIYSLGVVLYEMVTGQTPFEGDSPMSLALSHITSTPPLPRSLRPDLPEYAQAVILKALEKRPENRWQTAGEMVEALRKAYRGINPGVVLSHEGLDGPDLPSTLQAATAARKRADAAPATLPLTSGLEAQARGGGAAPTAGVERTRYMGGRARQTQPVARRRRFPWLVIPTMLVILLVGSVVILGARPADEVQFNTSPTALPGPHLRLIYWADNFAIFNTSDRPVSILNLSFQLEESPRAFALSEQSELKGKDFLEPGQCLLLVVDRPGNTRTLVPEVCPLLRSRRLTGIRDAERFWVGSGSRDVFIVRQGNTEVQTCSAKLNTCEFTLP